MPEFIRGFFIVFLLGFSGASSAQLPPEIVADKYLIHAEQLHTAKDFAGAFEVMRKIVALQEAHKLELPDDFHFKYARVALAADSMKIALESVSKYLSATGKDGQFYNEALVLLLKAEGNQVEPEVDFYNDVIKADGTCHDALPEGTGCWKELTKPPECYVWDDHFRQGQIAIWNGKCSGHRPDGKGTLTWYSTELDKLGKQVHGIEKESTGRYQDGKLEGKWVTSYGRSGGNTIEVLYRNGNQHGLAVRRRREKNYIDAYFQVYLDGKRLDQWGNDLHHDWTLEVEGPDENGNGRLFFRAPDGSVWGGPYVAGKRHGKWVEKSYTAFSNVSALHLESEGSYANGKRDGHWVSRELTDGKIYEGPYVDGEMHGHWILSLGEYTTLTNIFGSGIVGEGPIVYNERHGQWIYRHPNGDKFRVKYVNGDMQQPYLWHDYDDKKCWSVTSDHVRIENQKRVKKQVCLQWVK